MTPPPFSATVAVLANAILMSDREIEELENESPILGLKPQPREDSSGHSLWRTSLAAYTTMLGLLLIGLLAAIGHHCFYSYLNNRQIDDSLSQTWASRIGNAFAYLFKSALVAAVAVAYAQGFWFFVRRKSLEIGSLDKYFGVLYNPLSFFNTDLLRNTTLLFGLATVSWLLPLAAVFAPGTLTGYSQLSDKSNRVQCRRPSNPYLQMSAYRP